MLVLSLGMVAGGLLGCGRKGDLELPPPQSASEQTAPEATVEDEGS